MPAPRPSPRLIGALPARGVWNAVGLGRGQFLAILALSVAGFVLIGGPVWRHVHDPHFVRIVASYRRSPRWSAQPCCGTRPSPGATSPAGRS